MWEIGNEIYGAWQIGHCAFVGSHKMQDKGPAMYDDIYRIPLVAQLPNGRRGAIEERFVSLIDFPATFLDLAGVPVPEEYDGRSLEVEPVQVAAQFRKKIGVSEQAPKYPDSPLVEDGLVPQVGFEPTTL